MEPQCNLIIDSCCDLPSDVVARDGVYLLEFPYFDSQGEHSDDLFVTSSAKDFFDGMRKGEEPHTAQLSMSALTQAFKWAREQGKPAVYFCFSSGLSGTYDTACMILEQLKEEDPELDVTVVDTRLASTAEALFVYEALRQRERGLTAEELADWARESRNYIRCEFMVEDLEALRRGGRIPATVAFAGAKLDVKPILTIENDGTLGLVSIARGRKKGMKTMIEFYEKTRVDQHPNIVVTGNADCEKDAKRFADMIRDNDESTMILETSIGPVIGSHVGPDMLSIVFWGKDQREEISMADRIANKIKRK